MYDQFSVFGFTIHQIYKWSLSQIYSALPVKRSLYIPEDPDSAQINKPQSA